MNYELFIRKGFYIKEMPPDVKHQTANPPNSKLNLNRIKPIPPIQMHNMKQPRSDKLL